ncbi:MAG: hypothetical protein J3Q66DRAFT_143732 [Benniella sp.]|nr:MAG: hypothetical protein J3Q66DRAFT_143732 [Benniella sp.]
MLGRRRGGAKSVQGSIEKRIGCCTVGRQVHVAALFRVKRLLLLLQLQLLLLLKVMAECGGTVTGIEHEGGWWVWVGGAVSIDVGYTGALLADKGRHLVRVVEGRGRRVGGGGARDAAKVGGARRVGGGGGGGGGGHEIGGATLVGTVGLSFGSVLFAHQAPVAVDAVHGKRGVFRVVVVVRVEGGSESGKRIVARGCVSGGGGGEEGKRKKKRKERERAGER